MTRNIIEGSEKWIKRIPDEYAIEHVEAYISPVEREKMILKFNYVKNICGSFGTGFEKRTGLLKVAHNIGEFFEGIIICINDLSEQPCVYYKISCEIEYVTNLKRCEVTDTVVYNPLKFSNVVHYSGRCRERQKCDKNAPYWLKKFAKDKCANVAYFQF